MGAAEVWNKVKKEEAVTAICKRVAQGESLVSILRQKDKTLPSYTTFYEWVNDDKTIADRYARARDERAELLFEEILQIADETESDIYKSDGVEKVNHEAINRSKLRVDARKWVLAKMNNGKYGDKLDIDQKNTHAIDKDTAEVLKEVSKILKDESGS